MVARENSPTTGLAKLGHDKTLVREEYSVAILWVEVLRERVREGDLETPRTSHQEEGAGRKMKTRL